jgi:hypothetical protein
MDSTTAQYRGKRSRGSVRGKQQLRALFLSADGACSKGALSTVEMLDQLGVVSSVALATLIKYSGNIDYTK